MTMSSPEQSKKSLKISQSNELTEAAYYLPIQAKRVLWLCLMQCYYKKDEPEDIPPLFQLLVSDYQRHFHVNAEMASKDMKKGIKTLSETSVTFFPKSGEYEEITMPWLALSGLKRGRGKWDVEFNNRLMPYLVGLTSQFTTYGLYDVGKISSVRTIRLYESLCQFRSSGIWITTHEWLSERFLLPDSQRKNIAELKRGFLNPSLKKINETTPLMVALSQDEEGKLIFTIQEKTPVLS